MAANYWNSTQKEHWQFSRETLADLRKTLEDEDTKKGLLNVYPLPDYRHLNIYFHSLIQKLGRRLGARQQALATAELYMKRFFMKVSLRETNVFLVLSTCVYLACKMEESPQHIRTVVQEARTLFQDFVTADTTKLAECEFHLISELNSYLIVHHPYRTISELQAPLKLTSEEVITSWSFVNDAYMTDLPFLYPPHILALTAIFLSVLVRAAAHASQNSASSSGSNTGSSSASAAGSSGNSATSSGFSGNGGNISMGNNSTVGSSSKGISGGAASSGSEALAAANNSTLSTVSNTSAGGVSSHANNSHSSGTNSGRTSIAAGANPNLNSWGTGTVSTPISMTSGSGVGAINGAVVSSAIGNLNTLATKGKATGIHISSNRTSHLMDWFAESGVDMEAIIEGTQEMISLYDVWESQSDKICKDHIARIIRGRQLV